MRITVTHRLDDTYIEKAWKNAELEEIEDLAAELLGTRSPKHRGRFDLHSLPCFPMRLQNGHWQQPDKHE
jgi:hypothetical protein